MIIIIVFCFDFFSRIKRTTSQYAHISILILNFLGASLAANAFEFLSCLSWQKNETLSPINVNFQRLKKLKIVRPRSFLLSN